MKRSPVSGDLFVCWATVSIAAGLPMMTARPPITLPHVHERVVEAASAAPVGRLLRSEDVHREALAARIREPAEWHPGHARPDAIRHAADGADFTAPVSHGHVLPVGDASRPRICRVDLDEQLARAAAMPVLIAVSRIQEVQLLPRDQLQTAVRSNLAGRWQRVVPGLAQRLGVQLRLSASGWEAAVCKRAPVLRT